MRKSRLPCWTVPVTDTLDRLLEEAVRSDTHVSKADLIRDAVRHRLREMGFIHGIGDSQSDK